MENFRHQVTIHLGQACHSTIVDTERQVKLFINKFIPDFETTIKASHKSTNFGRFNSVMDVYQGESKKGLYGVITRKFEV